MNAPVTTCWFCFNQDRDLELWAPRNGNVANADDWRSVLEPVVARYLATAPWVPSAVISGVMWASPTRGYTSSSKPRAYSYTIRLPANAVLYREVQKPDDPLRWAARRKSPARDVSTPLHLSGRPPGARPAAWWRRSSGIQGELFPRVGFIVTNLAGWGGGGVRDLVLQRSGHGRSSASKRARSPLTLWTRLSCHDFVDNQVRLQLFALAYNLGNFLRSTGHARPCVKHWTLTTLRNKLIKIGAKVVSHGRYVTFQMAEIAVSTTDVPGDRVADWPVAGTTRTGMSNARVESDRRQWKSCVLMKAEPPTLTLAGREHIASATDNVRLPHKTRCHGASTGRPLPFWTRKSGECRSTRPWMKKRTRSAAAQHRALW